jgi:hypothetical protein
MCICRKITIDEKSDEDQEECPEIDEEKNTMIPCEIQQPISGK